MKVNMLYRDREELRAGGYLDKDDILKDFNYDVIRKTLEEERKRTEEEQPKMADQDTYLENVFQKVILIPLETADEIVYRQGFMREAMRQPKLFEELYQIAKMAAADIDKRKEDVKARKAASGGGYQGATILGTMTFLKQIGAHMEKLSALLKNYESMLVSEEMKTFTQNFMREYNVEFVENYQKIIADIENLMNGGTLVLGSKLGEGMKQTQIYIKDVGSTEATRGQFGRLKSFFSSDSKLLIGDTLTESAEKLRNAAVTYILHFFDDFIEDKVNFFKHLRFQTAFYTCAARLYGRLKNCGVSMCFPEVTDRKDMAFCELTELTLCLHTNRAPVGNELDSMDKWLVVVTGANQGGKSTYLRSIGLAQLFMQAGLFVTAKTFQSGIYRNIFTHFTRREDSTMNSGRLVEELQRMDSIMNNMTEDSILFLNESFATTTEKEGSAIAWDITKALYEVGVRVMTVTHLIEFAQKCYEEKMEHAVFLSAERVAGGKRTYRIRESEPEMTSYGLDLYEDMIGKVDKELLESV